MKELGSDYDSDDSGASDFTEGDGESSDVATNSEDSEGMDWDEMEAKTIE